MKMPKRVKQALDGTGRIWHVRPGKKHNLLYFDGQMIAILPHGRGKKDWHADENLLATIRRITRE